MNWLKVLVLVGMTGLANGCGSKPPQAEQPVAAAAKAPEPENEAAIAAARANPLDGLAKAYQKAFETNSYRVRLEATREDITATTTYEFVAPDRFRMITGPTELIVIGDAPFLKTLGSWQKATTGLQTQMKSIRDPQMVEKLRKSTDAKFAQPDTLAGKPMLVFECSAKDLLGAEGATYAKTWIGVLDGLPHKAEFEGMTGSVKTKGVMTWYDYNAEIKIEPPIK
ncbi:MAG: hypothetical protein HY011_26350 [Acidobacteria bacterium]|nr:hypothetical protein [Acidobacteriota bacterium]